MAAKPTLTEKYDILSSNLYTLTEAVGRLDERVGIFVEKINSLENKIEHHIDKCPVKCEFSNFVTRLSVLESKNGDEIKTSVSELRQQHQSDIKGIYKAIYEINNALNVSKVEQVEMKVEQGVIKEAANREESKWKIVGWVALNTLVPIVWVIIASAILYKLGITSPPTP